MATEYTITRLDGLDAKTVMTSAYLMPIYNLNGTVVGDENGLDHFITYGNFLSGILADLPEVGTKDNNYFATVLSDATANKTPTDLVPGLSVDGYALQADDVVFLYNTANRDEIGLYLVIAGGGAATRLTTYDSEEAIIQSVIKIWKGTTYKNTEWQCITATPIVPDTTDLYFNQIKSVQYSAGAYTLDEAIITGLTASELIATSAGKQLVSLASPTLTEIGYLEGVNSNIQTQFTNLDVHLGEIFTYTNTAVITIRETVVYHALHDSGLEAGEFEGTEIVLGLEGEIASVADYSGTFPGTVLITVTAGHGLGDADSISYITQNATTDYNGTYMATVVNATTYYITETYTSTRTGYFQRGFGIKILSTGAGLYRCMFGATVFAASNGTVFRIEARINDEEPAKDKVVCSNKFSNAPDYTPMVASGYLELAVGDVVWLAIRNETNTTNLTIRHGNFNINRLKAV